MNLKLSQIMELYNFHKKTEYYEVVQLSDNFDGYEQIRSILTQTILGLHTNDSVLDLDLKTCQKAAKLLNNQCGLDIYGVAIHSTSVHNVKK